MSVARDYDYSRCKLGDGEIRVLTIVPNRHRQDPIECRLKSRHLNDLGDREQRYEALSYHWGPKDPIYEVTILNEEGRPNLDSEATHTVKITPNLHAALTRFRYPDRERTLWVDAICINQRDNTERSGQVRLMAEIFNRAKMVCVWLGTESEDSDLAFEFIPQMLTLKSFDGLTRDNKYAKHWIALTSLMKRSWFSRRWVVQELALAWKVEVYCGMACITWDEFADAISLCEAAETDNRKVSEIIRKSDHFNHIPDGLGQIEFLGATRLVDATSKLFRKSQDGKILENLMTLETLVSTLVAFKATDPRDIIYAVLNIAKGIRTTAQNSKSLPQEISSPGTRSNNVPDFLARMFAKSLRVAVERSKFDLDYDKEFFDVCKDFLVSTIAESKSLDIICRPWVPVEAMEDKVRPSWLLTTKLSAFGIRPDGYYTRKNGDTLVGIPHLGNTSYHAARTTVTECNFGGPDGRSLFVKGFLIDEVYENFSYAGDGIILDEWLEAAGWTDRSKFPPEEFWRTLVANCGPNGINPPRYYPRACMAAAKEGVPGDSIVTKDSIYYGQSAIVAAFLRRVQEVIWMRRLVKTKDNRLGLAPKGTQKGDLICILYGCSVPVILRKKAILAPTRKSNNETSINFEHSTSLGRTSASEISKPTAKRQRVGHDVETSGMQPAKKRRKRKRNSQTSSRDGTSKAQNNAHGSENEREKQDDYFEFIGESYVHGIMNGEAFATHQSSDIHIKKFELR